MEVKTQGKAGLSGVNHDETLVRVQKPTTGLKVKTHIKAEVSVPFKDSNVAWKAYLVPNLNVS
jgi:hypothetical protein